MFRMQLIPGQLFIVYPLLREPELNLFKLNAESFCVICMYKFHYPVNAYHYQYENTRHLFEFVLFLPLLLFILYYFLRKPDKVRIYL